MSFFCSLYGQENKVTYSAFAIDNKEVVWVQVYHAHQPSGQLTDRVFDLLKRKSWIKKSAFRRTGTRRRPSELPS